MRKLIQEADPDVVEEWKWMGTPVWSHDGIICTGESYKSVVKLTFAKGAALKDPARLFNSSLDGNVRRAIDIPGRMTCKALIRQAVALNSAGKSKSSRKAKSRKLKDGAHCTVVARTRENPAPSGTSRPARRACHHHGRAEERRTIQDARQECPNLGRHVPQHRTNLRLRPHRPLQPGGQGRGPGLRFRNRPVDPGTGKSRATRSRSRRASA